MRWQAQVDTAWALLGLERLCGVQEALESLVSHQDSYESPAMRGFFGFGILESGGQYLSLPHPQPLLKAVSHLNQQKS